MSRNPSSRSRIIVVLAVLALLSACALPDRFPTDRDGGIGGTGAMAE